MRLVPWLGRGARLLLAASVLVALASVVEAARGAAVSWVAILIAVALSLWIAGAGLDALATIAWSDEEDE
jgi:hypothetical protein